jgi:phosphotransferase system HPr (HPr) family protein
MRDRSVTVAGEHGLHARPAAQFVETALRYTSAIKVQKADRAVNAKSLISLLSLGINRGSVITISADGPDEAAALVALAAVVEDATA